MKQFSELVTDYTILKLNLKEVMYSKLEFIQANSGVIDMGEYIVDTDNFTVTGFVNIMHNKKECGTMSFSRENSDAAIKNIKNYLVNVICK